MQCLVFFLLQFSSLVPDVFMLFDTCLTPPILRGYHLLLILLICVRDVFPIILVDLIGNLVNLQPLMLVLSSATFSCLDVSYMQLAVSPLVVTLFPYFCKMLKDCVWLCPRSVSKCLHTVVGYIISVLLSLGLYHLYPGQYIYSFQMPLAPVFATISCNTLFLCLLWNI